MRQLTRNNYNSKCVMSIFIFAYPRTSMNTRRLLGMWRILDSLSAHEFRPDSRLNSSNKTVYNICVSCHPDTEIVIARGNCYRAINGGTMPVGHSSENIRSPLASYPEGGLSRVHVIHRVRCPPAETFE